MSKRGTYPHRTIRCPTRLARRRRRASPDRRTTEGVNPPCPGTMRAHHPRWVLSRGAGSREGRRATRGIAGNAFGHRAGVSARRIHAAARCAPALGRPPRGDVRRGFFSRLPVGVFGEGPDRESAGHGRRVRRRSRIPRALRVETRAWKRRDARRVRRDAPTRPSRVSNRDSPPIPRF